MERVLPIVAEIAAQHPRQTVFTRFRAPWVADNATGQWQNLYRKWPQVTQRECDPALFELTDPLRELAPPATIFDKSAYSAFATGELKTMLDRRRADALIITGSETDVCVVATVMQAIDIGYRVIVVTNAICSPRRQHQRATRRGSRYSSSGQNLTLGALARPRCSGRF